MSRSGRTGASSSTTTRTRGAGRWRRSTRFGRGRGARARRRSRWKEIDRGCRIEDFRLDNVRARLAKTGDLWKPLLQATRPGRPREACSAGPARIEIELRKDAPAKDPDGDVVRRPARRTSRPGRPPIVGWISAPVISSGTSGRRAASGSKTREVFHVVAGGSRSRSGPTISRGKGEGPTAIAARRRASARRPRRRPSTVMSVSSGTYSPSRNSRDSAARSAGRSRDEQLDAAVAPVVKHRRNRRGPLRSAGKKASISSSIAPGG